MSAPAIASSAVRPDADILAAWGRLSVARAVLSGLPCSQGPIPSYTPEEQEQIDIMDEAEAVIHDATAETPQGVAIQLWTGLSHMLIDPNAEAAANITDLDWFFMDETRFDWPERLLLSALRSLRAIGGAA